MINHDKADLNMTEKLSGWEYGKELTEEYDHKIDLSLGRYVDDTTYQKSRIKSVIDKGMQFIPDNERVKFVELVLDPWNKPKVTIWCSSQGFDYSNSQVHAVRALDRGHGIDILVDVRPF